MKTTKLKNQAKDLTDTSPETTDSNKDIKRYPTSYATMKLQTKTTKHYTLTRRAKIQNTPPNGEDDDLLQELALIAGGDAKWYSHLGRQFGSF